MNILALDQSLKVTGAAVFYEDKLIYHKTYNINANQKMGYRLQDIWATLNSLTHDWDIDKIYFEDIQLQAGNVLTYKHLAYVQAAIIMWCNFNQMPYDIYPASHWRKVLGGKFGRKREEQKQHAIDLVQDYCGQEVTSDEADAICIGLAAIKERKENTVGFSSV